MNRVLATLPIVAILVAGCEADEPSPSTDPAVHETSPTLSPTTEAVPERRIMIIPDVAGEELETARNIVRERGLRVVVFKAVGSACQPKGVVVSQRPGPGRRIEIGSRVTLIVSPHWPGECGRDLPSASQELQSIGRLFVDFARDAESGPDGIPADTPVDFYIGGRLAKVVPSSRLSDRHNWQGCPGDIGYAGRDCPISLFTPFVAYPGPIAMTNQEPAHPCVHGWKLPAALDVYRSVTLTPDENRDCTSYFAVQLFVNDVHQIVAINLVLSDP